VTSFALEEAATYYDLIGAFRSAVNCPHGESGEARSIVLRCQNADKPEKRGLCPKTAHLDTVTGI